MAVGRGWFDGAGDLAPRASRVAHSSLELCKSTSAVPTELPVEPAGGQFVDLRAPLAILPSESVRSWCA